MIRVITLTVQNAAKLNSSNVTHGMNYCNCLDSMMMTTKKKNKICMKPGATVITKDGKEGIVSLIVPATQWVSQRLVYVDFEKPNPHWNIFLESDLKVKE